jgi:gliding motility-associated-like protein
MVAPSSTTTYEVTVEDGCSTPSASDSVEIALHDLPDVKFSGTDLEGCRPVKASFTNETDPSEVGGDCIWSFGNGGQAVGCSGAEQRFEKPGCYDVKLRLRSRDGCVDSTRKKKMVCVRPYPKAKFLMEPESTIVQDPEVKFTNLSTGEVEWQWHFAGLDSSEARHPSYNFPNESEGSYQVCLFVRNSYDCADTACREVRINGDFVVYVPNAFSPDGDGENDIFRPVVQGYDESEYRFMIFDRWGEKVFETDDPEQGWDGHIKGNGARHSDVYVWKLITKDRFTGKKVKRSGHVTLIR